MMNTELARYNMLAQQFRACDVVQEDLLTLFQSTPREAFVPPLYENLAFADLALPLGVADEVMLTPLLEAKILNAVDIKSYEHVLEVGTGSGYMTCLLGKLAQTVVSCDIHMELLEPVKQKLAAYGVHDVALFHHDASAGFASQGPYNVIIYTGSLPELPNYVLDQLAPGGRMFIVLGRAPAMKATLIKKAELGQIEQQVLFETVVPALTCKQKESFFVF